MNTRNDDWELAVELRGTIAAATETLMWLTSRKMTDSEQDAVDRSLMLLGEYAARLRTHRKRRSNAAKIRNDYKISMLKNKG